MKSAASGTYSLSVTESVGLRDVRTRRRLPHSLVIDLYSQATSPAADVSVAIASRPFMIAAASAWYAQPGAGGAQFAQWSSADGGRWLAKSIQGMQTLLLPPQALGEAMERLRENAPTSESGAYPTGEDVDEGMVVATRFSPVATIEFNPSEAAATTATCPGTVARLRLRRRRRLRRGAEQRAVRAVVWHERDRLGAPGRSVPAANRRGRRSLRCLSGGLQDGVDLQTGDSALKSRATDYLNAWNALHGALGSRLGMLRVWRPQTSQPSSLTDGVSFHLRETARLRWPFDPPVPPEYSRDLSPPNGPFTADANEGLAGGVGWLFESQNVLQATWRDPDSNDGDVNGLSFSALGGLGSQRGFFNNRLTIITSDTISPRGATSASRWCGSVASRGSGIAPDT